MVRLLLALLLLGVPLLASAQEASAPGPGPVGPAPDGPHPARIGEIVEPPPPRGYAEDIKVLKQTKEFGIAPGAVQYDTAAPAPQAQAAAEPAPAAPDLDVNFNGISYSSSIPPDPVIAAGPTTLVLVTNGSVTIRDKSGSLISSASLAEFFTPVRLFDENAFDPRVVYDTGSGRFFLSALGRITNPTCAPGSCVSHFFLAVSKSSSPTTTGSGDWYVYGFDATLNGSTPTANWADFDGLGVDGSVVVLTANMYSFSADASQYSKVRIVNKAPLLTGGTVTWFDFWDLQEPSTSFTSGTVQPALTFGSPDTFFLVSKSATLNSCNVIVWGIANAASAPVLSKRAALAAGGTCANQPDAAQLGGGTPLDSGDTRLQNSVYRNGSLWATHSMRMNFGSGDVSAIRWVQIDVSGWPGSVSFVQDSTLGLDGVWYFYPAVMVDAANNLGMVFARSSASEYASARYTGRLATDPVNALQPIALLVAGAANYVHLSSAGANRWGDYSGIALDPSDQSFWLLGEYAATATTWGAWVGNFTLSNPAPILSSLSPPTTTAGGAQFTLAVNGSKFVPSSVVRWNGESRGTTFVSAGELQATILASDIASGATALVTVFSPAPGGGTSGAATFTVNNPVPVLGSLSPTTATAGGAQFTLTVNGSGFVPVSTVQWNGAARTTTFVSATQLQATILAADVASGGTAEVTVSTSTPGGGTSGLAAFTINNPMPVLGSISPATAVMGGAQFTVTANGSGFVSASTVRWNGAARTTTFATATQLQATIPAADIAAVGTAEVTVFTPTPGGGTSGGATFTITPPTFALTVTIKGSAAGAVTSSPGGISCMPTCSATFTTNDSVGLTASPESGASFKGWGGACAGAATTCTVTMSAAQTVTATFSKIFTDATLTPQATAVKAVHIAELRAAIDTLRGRYSLATFAWADPVLTAGHSVVKAAHLSDLRAALAEAYQSAGQTPGAYTDPTIVGATTRIKAAHVSELRTNVRALE